MAALGDDDVEEFAPAIFDDFAAFFDDGELVSLRALLRMSLEEDHAREDLTSALAMRWWSASG